MCVDGSVCDKDTICRILPGAQCSTINGEYCGLGTQCEGGSCRLLLGATCLTNGIQCSPGLVCDSLGQCRIPADGSCSERPRGCLAGANCNSDKCECQTDNCIPSSGKIGSMCTVTDEDPQGKETCSDPFAICDSNNGVCQCNGDFETLRANFTCAKGPGSNCNTTSPCTTGLVCDYGNICVIDAGDSCEGRKIRYCRRGTICDKDSFCRWTSGEDCQSRKDMCAVGQRCDSSGVCKLPLNKECNYNEACEVGAHCDGNTSLCTCTEGIAKPTTQGDSCEPSPGRVGGDCSPQCLDPNSVCNNQKCECSPGFSVNNKDFTCTKELGESCENDEECGPGASCDSGKECSLLLGQSCRGKLKENCGQVAVCDKNDECKIKGQGTCDRNAFLPCEVGTFCDWLGVCRQEASGSCDNVTSLCAAGAVCVDKSCQCDKDISVAFDVVCKPADGRVGAECNNVNLKCTAAGAKCVGAVCVCADGVKTTSEFGCSGVSEKKETPTSSVSMLGLIVGVAVSTLLLCCCLGFVIFKRSKKSKEKAQDLIKERAKAMADLSALAHGATPDGKAIQADPASQSAGNAKQADPASQSTDSAIEGETSSGVQEESVGDKDGKESNSK
ncbi:multiple epidermal growth factor-like domains protein 10 [Littorina saxatilis]|uniref:multiple epidermal growth factor-like domains protein 10 n=1 Tax=Littorina saxatilis TaxID=31220 RepID=UPI0038B5E047